MKHRCGSLVALLLWGAAPVFAQQTVAAAPSANSAAGEALLARRVTVHAKRKTVHEIVDALGASARIEIQYAARALDAYTTPLTLHLSNVPLGTALEQALNGTHLRVLVLPGPHIAVVASGDDESRVVETGIITGQVTNAKTKVAVRNARVVLDDDSAGVRTDEHGAYRFAGVAPGKHRITVRSVGFARQTRSVTVTDGGTATADFALEASANTLDQVVITATGAQRVRELGHVVAQINADSLVKNAPITSVSEMLQSRIPGLQISTGDGGMAGGEVSLRLRGTSTSYLNPEPIVIVDGVRYQSNNLVERSGRIGQDPRNRYGELQSPLNDLNVNDIETVEVVKGPSASTLYGPDASNGVIVITTKRGTPGATKFNWYARPISNSVPKTRIEHGNQVWAHTPTGELFDGQCTLIYQYEFNLCTIDSIRPAPTLINNDQYSVLAKSRPAWQYGANLSGGESKLRYFLSGNYDTQTGALQVPPGLRPYLKEQLGVTSLSDDQLTPNRLQVITTHGNLSTDVTKASSVGLSIGYTQSTHRTVETSVFNSQYQNTGVPRASDNALPINPNHNEYYSALSLALRNTTELKKRWTAALTGNAQLLPWLSANAVVGLDLDGSTTRSILPAGELQGQLDGSASDDRRDNTGRTLTLAATANAHPGVLSFRTTAGMQYAYANLDGIEVSGTGLAAGSTSIGTAVNVRYIEQLWSETVTLGTYGEEVVGLNDRLFVTGSLRIDGATALGDAYHPKPYPKAGVSWIVSDEPFMPHLPGLSSLRLRASTGAASRYPTSEMKLGVVSGGSGLIENQNLNVFDRSELANPNIRPEHSRETEWGSDITLGSATNIGLTWHHRIINDQIAYYPNTYGLPAGFRNIGDQSAHGFEATATVPLFDLHGVRADMGMSYSVQRNKVLSLGGLPESKQPYPAGQAIGFPTSAVFGERVIGVADTVGGHADGIIFRNEVIRDTVFRYLGVTEPPKTLTLTPRVALWNGRIRISSLFDRQTGFVRQDDAGRNCVNNALCSAPFVLGSNVLEQAKHVNLNTEDFIVPGDFTRWREFNVSVDVPQRLLRVDALHLHFSSATVSLQGRNLMLHTAYRGSDPESHQRLDNLASDGIPQARSWSFRFDITP